MKVPFVDLKAQYTAYKQEFDEALERTISSCDYVLGKDVIEFESNFASYLGSKYVIGVGNGLDALRLALAGLKIGPGDEVILPASTYIATALAVSAVGARPVLVEAEPETLNMDARLIEKAITNRTRALIPVHLYGQPADMTEIVGIAKAHKLAVVEDACQSHGACYNKQRTGSIGNAGCFSFYPSKNLGTTGDAGAIATSDEELARTLMRLRNYGQREKYYNQEKGWNSRLDSLHAAILNVKLKHLDKWNAQRVEHADLYDRLLADIAEVKAPVRKPDRDHIFHLYVIRCRRRDQLQAYLRQREVLTQIHYPLPIHLQEAYADLKYAKGSFAISEQAAGEVLSLPMYAELNAEQIHYVVDLIRQFYSE